MVIDATEDLSDIGARRTRASCWGRHVIAGPDAVAPPGGGGLAQMLDDGEVADATTTVPRARPKADMSRVGRTGRPTCLIRIHPAMMPPRSRP